MTLTCPVCGPLALDARETASAQRYVDAFARGGYTLRALTCPSCNREVSTTALSARDVETKEAA